METLPLTKVCTKCGEEKELSEFSKNKNIKSGFASICKNCNNLYHKYPHPRILLSDEEKKQRKKLNKKKYKKSKGNIIAQKKIAREYLKDRYLKHLITKQFSDISLTDITPEMILLKKVEVKSKRIIKNQINTTL